MSMSITHRIRSDPLGWLQNQVRRAAAALFAEPDAQAIRNGWTVTERRGGLSRTYRDPRFDSLIRCLSCGGSGLIGAAARGACVACRGSGRVVRTPRRTGQEVTP